MKCPKCEYEGIFGHSHEQVCGIPGSHMSGTERFSCPGCGYIIRKSDEAEGFVFFFD